MNIHQRSVFILAEPGPFREALTALVASLPAGTGIYLEDMAGPAIGRISALRPTVLLLDDDLLPGELTASISDLRSASPETFVILLTSTVQRQHEGSQTGVAAALVKGTPVGDLVAVLEELLGRAAGTQ